MTYLLSYDIGTTGVKTCIFSFDKSIKLVASATRSYNLYILPNGGAEQDADEWWGAMCESTHEVIKKSKVSSADIAGISFCSQMQGVVLVDKDGNPVHRPMSYMDQRATKEIKKGIAYGLQVAGANIFKLIPSLIITGAVTSSVKDPVWKYKWIEANEPANFKRVYKWLDVKDYLALRCTGNFAMTEDSAFATLIYDTRKGKQCWSKKMCSMFNINMNHLPDIIKSTDLVGALTEKAASELGLNVGTPVFGGGGDSSLIGLGAGASRLGDTHVYSGTSGWVITVVDKQMVDVTAMIAAITGAQSGRFNYFAEMETAGKALAWIKELLDDAEIGKNFENLNDIIDSVPAGSNGLVFTPWLHGNRCPFEDPNSTGMFVGLKLETDKKSMIKAVLEGVFYHLRWMLECENKKVKIHEEIRFVGGTALSSSACQMFADITGKRVETVESPQNIGAVGAAAITAVGLKLISNLDLVGNYIPAQGVYEPDMVKHAQYDRFYKAFCEIYNHNKKIFKEIKK